MPGKQTLKIFDHIKNLYKEYGVPPTLREIAKASGLRSTWTVRYHLNKLAEAGYIGIKKSISRGIEILKTGEIPVLGKISAGKPIEAIENAENFIGNITDIFGAKELFALRVKGDSMEGAGILDGDIVIVKKQTKAEKGEIVAAIFENEVTVKRFYLTDKGVKLLPENPKYEPIISKEIKILGKIVGVIRKY